MLINKCSWQIPEKWPNLQQKSIHLWKIDLTTLPGHNAIFFAHLSEEERFRATAFKNSGDCDRYIRVRGIVRTILGYYLGEKARNVTIKYNSFGKPYHKTNQVFFNVSHSSEMALLAVSISAEVGVDLELIDKTLDFAPIVERFFSETEKKAIHALPPEVKLEGFYKIWTRKEACIKAIGKGLAYPLACFSVPLAQVGIVRIVEDDNRHSRSTSLGVCMIDPKPGYIANLAYNDENHLAINGYIWETMKAASGTAN
jgi:4'-phosphopantetheinyl transferase